MRPPFNGTVYLLFSIRIDTSFIFTSENMLHYRIIVIEDPDYMFYL